MDIYVALKFARRWYFWAPPPNAEIRDDTLGREDKSIFSSASGWSICFSVSEAHGVTVISNFPRSLRQARQLSSYLYPSSVWWVPCVLNAFLERRQRSGLREKGRSSDSLFPLSMRRFYPWVSLLEVVAAIPSSLFLIFTMRLHVRVLKVRITLRRNPVLRDRLFYGVLAGAFAHGTYLVYPFHYSFPTFPDDPFICRVLIFLPGFLDFCQIVFFKKIFDEYSLTLFI